MSTYITNRNNWYSCNFFRVFRSVSNLYNFSRPKT